MFNLVEMFLDKFDMECLEQPGWHKETKNRMILLEEELDEVREAYKDRDFEGYIDGLVDIIYIALGNMYLNGVNPFPHFVEVHNSNMRKVRGAKPSRGFTFDVYKPDGWVGPDHIQIFLNKVPSEVINYYLREKGAVNGREAIEMYLEEAANDLGERA